MTTNVTPEVEDARLKAGWRNTRTGWVAACGTTEEAWKEAGYAMPEEPFYIDWRQAFSYYEDESA